MQASPPKYKIGDFVKCRYDFYDFFSYFHDEDYQYLPYYGIIVDIAWEDDWHDMETVYKVYCLDSEFRFFLEDEIKFV